MALVTPSELAKRKKLSYIPSPDEYSSGIVDDLPPVDEIMDTATKDDATSKKFLDLAVTAKAAADAQKAPTMAKPDDSPLLPTSDNPLSQPESSTSTPPSSDLSSSPSGSADEQPKAKASILRKLFGSEDSFTDYGLPMLGVLEAIASQGRDPGNTAMDIQKRLREQKQYDQQQANVTEDRKQKAIEKRNTNMYLDEIKNLNPDDPDYQKKAVKIAVKYEKDPTKVIEYMSKAKTPSQATPEMLDAIRKQYADSPYLASVLYEATSNPDKYAGLVTSDVTKADMKPKPSPLSDDEKKRLIATGNPSIIADGLSNPDNWRKMEKQMYISGSQNEVKLKMQHQKEDLELRRQEAYFDYQKQHGGAGGASTSDVMNVGPDDPSFIIFEDLAYGKLPISQLRTIAGRGADLRPYYEKARQINPSFNPAEYEQGFKSFENTGNQKVLANIKNAEQNIDKVMIPLSDAVARGDWPTVNKFVLASKYNTGNQPVSSYQTAQKVMVDEIGSALTQSGVMSDFKMHLGEAILDPNVSPEQFRTNMGILKEFLAQRRQSYESTFGAYAPGGSARTPVAQPGSAQPNVVQPAATVTPKGTVKIFDIGGGHQMKMKKLNDGPDNVQGNWDQSN